jgi:hypothetical protein
MSNTPAMRFEIITPNQCTRVAVTRSGSSGLTLLVGLQNQLRADVSGIVAAYKDKKRGAASLNSKETYRRYTVYQT